MRPMLEGSDRFRFYAIRANIHKDQGYFILDEVDNPIS